MKRKDKALLLAIASFFMSFSPIYAAYGMTENYQLSQSQGKGIKRELPPLPEISLQEKKRLELNEKGVNNFKKGMRSSNSSYFRNALLDFNESIAIKPDALIYFLKGWTYEELESPQSAITNYTKALAIQPHAGIYAFRAGIYSKLKRISDAIADYSSAIEMNNLDMANGVIDEFGINPLASAYYNYEYLRGEKNSYNTFRQYILNTYPKYYKMRANLYELLAYRNWPNNNDYESIKNLKNAISDYSKAITMNPQDEEAFRNRADAYYQIKDDQKAIVDYSRAIALNPKCRLNYLGRSMALSRINDHQNSIADIDKSFQLSKGRGLKLHCGKEYGSDFEWFKSQ